MNTPIFFLLCSFIVIWVISGQKHPEPGPEVASDGRSSELIKHKQQEIEKYTKGQHMLYSGDEGVEMFSFSLKHASQQFYLHTIQDYIVIFNLKILIKENKVYRQIQDITKQPPVQVTITKNSNTIVFNQTFYFYGSIQIEVNADDNFMIRFFSPSEDKVIFIEHTKVLDETFFMGKLKDTSTQHQQRKIKDLYGKFLMATRPLLSHHLIFDNNSSQLLKKMRVFFKFQIVEIIVLCGVCLLQVRIINRLFTKKEII